MNTLEEILNEAKKQLNVIEDKQLAEAIHVTPSAISNWRKRGSRPDLFALMQLSDVLSIDARELLSIIEAEHAKSEDKQEYWEKMKERFSGSKKELMTIIACGFIFSSADCKLDMGQNQSITYKYMTPKMYIMSS
ncbi:helix-turn-helix domain-containing protein [Iodobacter sp. CM08]|uniref:helix-turn-helix domain-containing protein n=1 Tax=Iodobacter sp. CM08 TaxID=3085902 RepID=UPI0029829E98|nr:helix-turn-helix domain-containing protein [Iodobacter sp. CM08]MDW5418870.1 helix-turn-helix domain-containing protein [Iodobacter sp. CM08]